ncbi:MULTISPECIES: ABC transporter ATP-binding protein [Pyrobaculum]|uniref:Oligopeptide/dipeptide ABC transporter, ATPase subunit n=2 Tax=Pyrobaculum arsenaticum TaxID=121277 RepID=A4WJH4_PYRAR|nr:ABC transporter ATP-binding protein [Pyrobaculum arsenaticum]ABP50541.1 oligopeptide/dipeptide ABC transporter, ATPase subunit [Pyrobaculum arsenaticum DSM 13514]MCY0890528.1 ABC transporter ATP-binding protein [Pyrobaculum arsenaticum]NYR14530.1 ABC transporter ATP-binding protein [Pyrobaculum arsenaticum]
MKALVKAERLSKYFPVGGLLRPRGYVKAVDNVDLEIYEGETLGLVGETGSGKTTLGRLILRLIEPTSGKIYFDGADVTKLSGKELATFRRKAQIIFQDPYMSLNPRFTVYQTLLEVIKVHKLPIQDPEEHIGKMLELVGLERSHLHRYPHEFSGGQRQRIAILRALILEPKFLVLDEPTSALDVSVQAQILNMLKDLQRRLGLTYLFISHDIGAVRYMSNRIAVMYMGKIVEIGPVDAVIKEPLHPYTQALISALPVPDPKIARSKKTVLLQGEPPSPINPPAGCRFHPRCPYFIKGKCDVEEPQLKEVKSGHYVACHLY